MKFYLAMCSLSLAAGTALGHFNGKYTAAARFVDDCDQQRFVVFLDRGADAQRRFHCFEITQPALEDRPEQPGRNHAPLI